MKNKWVVGLVGAVLNSIASTVTFLIVDPHVFSDWKKLVAMLGASALVGAALYVKNHPFEVGE